MPNTSTAMRDDRLRRTARTPSPRGDSRGGAGSVRAEPWVCPGIEEIGDQTAEGDHDTANDDAADDEWIIARADGIDDGVTHAGPRKDLLDEKGAGQQCRKRQSDQRDDRQQRVTQRVTTQHL